MDFLEIAKNRQSCRSYDSARAVEPEKLEAVLQAGRLAPSACNAQPYHMTVCTGETAAEIAAAVQGPGINKWASQAPVMIVITEDSYNRTSAVGSKLKHNDYRSIDIGILTAYLTAEAQTQGLSSCILGWFSNEKIQAACGFTDTVRLVIALGYASEGDPLRPKKRKDLEKLVTKR